MFNPEDEASQQTYELRLKTQVIQGISSLVEALHHHAEPEHFQAEFSYYQFVEPLGFTVPETIGQYGDIDRVNITYTQEPSELRKTSIDLLYDAAPERTLYVSSDPNIPDDKTTDDALIVHGEEKPRAIERIPAADLNRFIMGLLEKKDFIGFMPEDNVTREMALAPFDHMSMIGKLKEITHSWYEHSSYNLSERRSLSWTTRKHKSGETLETCRFSYETAAPDRNIVLTINPTQGLSMDFKIVDWSNTNWTLDALHENTGLQPFIPEDGDLLRVVEILRGYNKAARKINHIAVDPSDITLLEQTD